MYNDMGEWVTILPGVLNPVTMIEIQITLNSANFKKYIFLRRYL